MNDNPKRNKTLQQLLCVDRTRIGKMIVCQDYTRFTEAVLWTDASSLGEGLLNVYSMILLSPVRNRGSDQKARIRIYFCLQRCKGFCKIIIIIS